MIAKWYPHVADPQFGVFIRKQALAIARNRDIVVCTFYSETISEGSGFRTEIQRQERLTEYRIYYRKSNSVFKKIINTVIFFRAWFIARNLIWKNHGKPLIVMAYIMLRPAILAYITRVIYGIPFIVCEQWSGYTNGNFDQLSGLSRFLRRKLFSKADGRIAVSEFLKKSLVNLGFKNDIIVIPNVIEIQNQHVKSNQDKIRILVVADLVDEIKNISGILRACEGLLKDQPRLYLKIIGGGKDEKMLKQLSVELKISQEQIEFTGMQNNEVVYEELWNSSFLIMNSRFETFSLICAEALSCGKPVIATRCGGPEEFINSSNGMLIPADDDEALKMAIKEMLEQFNRYDPNQIRAKAIEQFSPESVGRIFEGVFNQLM